MVALMTAAGSERAPRAAGAPTRAPTAITRQGARTEHERRPRPASVGRRSTAAAGRAHSGVSALARGHVRRPHHVAS